MPFSPPTCTQITDVILHGIVIPPIWRSTYGPIGCRRNIGHILSHLSRWRLIKRQYRRCGIIVVRCSRSTVLGVGRRHRIEFYDLKLSDVISDNPPASVTFPVRVNGANGASRRKTQWQHHQDEYRSCDCLIRVDSDSPQRYRTLGKELEMVDKIIHPVCLSMPELNDSDSKPSGAVPTLS